VNRLVSHALAMSTMAVLAAAPAGAAPNCEGLARLALANTTITAESFTGGAITPPGRLTARDKKALQDLPAFCRVHGVLKPTASSNINFEVWLPTANWNGKLQVVGNGGMAGTISYPAMATSLKDGFATASTDTGHTASEPATWLEDLQRLIDYSYRGLHLTAVDARALVDAFYSKQPSYAYFTGCSTGGKQGLMEAQRYPEDFDGILAGDAANYWTHQMASEVWHGIVTGTPATNLPKEKLQILQDASIAACDKLDGAADGLVSNPMQCHFDPGTLLCKGADSPRCLTAAQVDAVRKMYSGPVNPRTGQSVYPGVYPGGEVGWGAGRSPTINRTTTSAVSSNAFWSYALFHDPTWQFRTFDFDRDLDRADAALAPVTNATDPDLSKFKSLGHKLIYYHGAADPLIPAQNGINYYDSVVKAQKSLAQTESFFRAFLVPGLYHCTGGPGVIAFGTGEEPPAGQDDANHDIVRALERWVESGTAPAEIIATKYVDGSRARGVALQRPLCPYPQVAMYQGAGDMNDAVNFSCVAPK
jgi:Tannase and feruloyl esterase